MPSGKDCLFARLIFFVLMRKMNSMPPLKLAFWLLGFRITRQLPFMTIQYSKAFLIVMGIELDIEKG